ncbi:MAG: hypothetical protein HY775_11755 [Acidobacteria bacterium]|nr:hypothetical protein [Acidobacteriota bacterium]
MSDERTLRKLRALAEDRGVSFAQVAREALDQKTAEYRPKPRSIGIGDSGRSDVSSRAGVGRTKPRTWR